MPLTNKQLVKAEFIQLSKLGIPLVISQIALTGMAVTDTIMAGQAGTNDLAGIAIAAGLWNPILMLLIGVLNGATPIMAQYFGSENWEKLTYKTFQALWLAVGSSIIVMAAVFLALPFLNLIDMSDAVRPIAYHYLLIITLGAPGVAIAQVLRSFCEANSQTKATMAVNISAFLINIVLDYIFVFGKFGAPELGGVGCGWATAILYWYTAIALSIHIAVSRRYNKYRPYFRIPKPDWKSIKAILNIGVPSSIGVCAEVSFFAVVALFLAPFGADVVSSHQIALNVSSVIFMIPLGMSMAIAIRSGQLLGQGNYVRARISAFTAISMTTSFAIITASITFLLRDPIVRFYSSDINVLEIARNLLIYNAIFQIIDATQIVSAGALRGYKDTKVPMIIQLISYWVVGFFVSYTLSLHPPMDESMGAAGFWLGFVAALSSAGILLFTRLTKVSKRPIETGQFNLE